MKKDRNLVRGKQHGGAEFDLKNVDEAMKVLVKAAFEVSKLGYNVTYDIEPLGANRIASGCKPEYILEVKEV